MDNSEAGRERPGAAERPPESGAAAPGRGGRMSRQRKMAAVLRLLRGEDLETVSRALGVTAATLTTWRDAFLAAGEVTLDVEPTTAVRQAEVTAAKTMIARTADRLGIDPARLAADTGYGSAEMLGWLVEERGIEPHIPVFDKSARTDGSLSRADFTYDHAGDAYTCPQGKLLTTRGTLVNDGATLIYRASKFDCTACELKPSCCPNTPARKVPRSIYEGARDMAREIAETDAYVVSRRERKKIEMLFAHLKRILRLDRLRLRGPCGARGEFLLAATAQNLRKLAKLMPLPQPATG